MFATIFLVNKDVYKMSRRYLCYVIVSKSSITVSMSYFLLTTLCVY